MLHFSDLVDRVGAFAAQLDITGIALDEGDLSVVVDQGYPVALVQPVMKQDRSCFAGAAGNIFDVAGGKVDAEGGGLAAGGESLGQDTGEKKGDRDKMLHGDWRIQR